MADRSTLWLIAGPDGVGKTTYARRYLRAVAGTERFVNLDEIARGFSPLTPTPDAETAVAAARAVLARCAETIAARRSFALETTLAGRTHLRTLEHAKAAGFATTLLFCILPDVEIALSRIAARVAAGGHAVPEADARRRFPRACGNFATYAAPPATCGASSTRSWRSRAWLPPDRRARSRIRRCTPCCRPRCARASLRWADPTRP